MTTLSKETERLDELASEIHGRQFDEERALDKLNARFAFSGLFDYTSNLPEDQLCMHAISPAICKYGLERVLGFFGGDNRSLSNLSRRMAILDRIDERFNFVSPVPYVLLGTSFFEILRQKHLNERDLERVWAGNHSPWFSEALKVNPELKDNVFRVYAFLLTCVNVPQGVGKLINLTSVYRKLTTEQIGLLRLYAKTGGDIPAEVLEHYAKTGVKDALDYQRFKEIHFRFQLEDIYSFAAARRDWDEAKALAEIGKDGYDSLASKETSKFTKADYIGKAALWSWINEHIDIVKSDFEYVAGLASPKDSPENIVPEQPSCE